MGNLKLTSSDFSDGDEIPRECGYKNGNRAPRLKWNLLDAFPEGHWPTSFALIMDDPDAMEAVGKVWVHWVVWNIPIKQDQMPEGAYDGAEGMTDFGKVGYGGPAPPDKRHTYVFKLYALDIGLDLPGKSTKADVEKAMKGHIIAEAKLTGTYAP